MDIFKRKVLNSHSKKNFCSSTRGKECIQLATLWEDYVEIAIQGGEIIRQPPQKEESYLNRRYWRDDI